MSKEKSPSGSKTLRTADICRRFGVSRESLRRWRHQGHFPEPKLLGPGTVAWDAEAVEAWYAGRPTVSLRGEGK